MVGAERASVVLVPSSLWQEPLFDVVSHSLSDDPAKDCSCDYETGVSDATRVSCNSEASFSHRFCLVVPSETALNMDASIVLFRLSLFSHSSDCRVADKHAPDSVSFLLFPECRVAERHAPDGVS